MRTLFIILAVLLFFHFDGVQAVQDPNQPDTLTIDSVMAYTTGSAVVPVSFFNDEELSGVEVTLTYDSPDVVLDSFSFADGRLESTQFKGFTYNSDSTVITIFAIDSIEAGSGLFGNLHFSWQPLIQPQLVLIDTATITIGQIDHTTAFSDTSFKTFVPIIQTGVINIQNEPPELDSVWLDNLDVVAGEGFALDVYFFNEDLVQEFRLALDYSTSLLHYDSVSLNGLRLIPSPINSPIVQNQNSTHELLVRLTFPEDNPLPVGTGPIARLFFTVDASTPEATYIIDTTRFANVISSLITRPASVGGKMFVPGFTPGSISVQIATDVRETEDDNLPSDFELAQNYPNPFNPTTQIRFSLPEAGHVSLDIYNVLGRRVRTVLDQYMSAGIHEVTFDGRGDDGATLASGVYFYRMTHPDYVDNKKMLLLK